MLNEEDTLTQAAREMREARLYDDVLRRGEAAVLARVRPAPAFARPLVLGATGLAALAFAAVALAPAQASAAEILRIARNGDGALRHVRVSTLRPDGSPGERMMDMYLQGGKRRFEFEHGDVFVYDGDRGYRNYGDGAVTIERQPSAPMNEEGLARDLLAANATGEGVRLSVERGKVDRYTIDRDLPVAGGESQHVRLVLEADPKSQRPLALRVKEPGSPERLTTWEYPGPKPALFRPLTAPKGRVYDLDAQRNSVLAALRSPGRRAIVRGQAVELVGVWVDEVGRASAVARADYPYPQDYGLRIDGVAAHRPEKPPFSGQWWVDEPSLFEGRGTQVFGLAHPLGDRNRIRLPDRVNVQLPVCRGRRFLGYARFDDVPVHRTYRVDFLKPDGRPFWDESPRRAATETKAVEATARP